MEFSRRDLFAAGTGLACPSIIPSGSGTAGRVRADRAAETAAIVALAEESNEALMRGDVAGYRALSPLTEDFTLMSPFGGTPTHGSQMSEEKWDAMGRFFRNGTLRHELVQSYRSEDMIVLAVIERAHVQVGSLPAQDWALRVTIVYRREGGRWKLAHRHADPLVSGITLKEAAALAEREAP